MANNLTNVAEALMLDWLHAVGTPTRPTSPLKLALFTAAPGEAAGGTEVTGGSYARTTVTISAASGGSTLNSADVTFPTASASWGTVTHVAIFDSAGSPVMLWYGPLAASKTVDSGDTFKVPSGSLTIALD